MYADGKPFYSLNCYTKETFGGKLYKVSLHAGMTCPNRDNTIGRRGCIFCSAGGSGEFAGAPDQSIRAQIETGIQKLQSKVKADGYIAYFQAYTNTYAPTERLREIFMEAISHPKVRVLSIATRPDCLPKDVLQLLEELNRIKPVWIELGLQTIHPESADFIRRGYDLSCFCSAVSALRSRGIDVIVHTIYGLPTESEEDFFDTLRYLNSCDIKGLKIHLLHILKGTDLADIYEAHPFFLPSLEEYCQTLGKGISLLRPDLVLHRITGDGPKSLLIAPLWTGQKKHVMNTILNYLKENHIFQGKDYPNG